MINVKGPGFDAEPVLSNSFVTWYLSCIGPHFIDQETDMLIS